MEKALSDSSLQTMAYFRNSAVNLVNLHYAIHAVALYGGGAFYFVFLIKAGVPSPPLSVPSAV